MTKRCAAEVLHSAPIPSRSGGREVTCDLWVVCVTIKTCVQLELACRGLSTAENKLI